MVRSSRVAVGAIVLALGCGLFIAAGCATDEVLGPQRDTKMSPDGASAADAPAIPLAGRTEVDLAKEMALHREMYKRYLRALATFYGETGYEQKARYARDELRGLSRVRMFNYITDGELPAADAEGGAKLDLPNIQLKGRNEPDLVEDMVLHRKNYAGFLQTLVAYYSENGLDKKANWARTELKDLQTVRTYNYIQDAELPLASLRPTESIADADRLYAEGLKLMDKGGHHVIIFFNRETMNVALSKFKELIAKYPTSDKIDDAAYYIAEIYREYGEEKDNLLAVAWYKRAIDWNPKLPHPAWSHAAHVLDFRLHEREKALAWYQKVIENEAGKEKQDIRFLGDVEVAQKRIRELTSEKTRYADGEPTPAAEASPAPVPVNGGK